MLELPLDVHDVLAVNAAFYRAFAEGDFGAMAGLWSRDEAISCVHPGHSPLTGYAPVMAAWQQILSSPPSIRYDHPNVSRFGDTAIVVCHERLPGIRLVATNVYRLEADGWKLCHHQAGLLGREENEDEKAPSKKKLLN